MFMALGRYYNPLEQKWLGISANALIDLDGRSVTIEDIAKIQQTINKLNTNIDSVIQNKAEKSDIPKTLSALKDDIGYNDNIKHLTTTKADKKDVPKKVSDLENDSRFVSDSVTQAIDKELKTHTHNWSSISGKPTEWAREVFQTRDNSIGLEKNLLFNAQDRFEIIEINSKATNLSEFFNGTLSSANVSNISPEKPYILHIKGLPNIHTQGKGRIGWIGRYRTPVDFKIEYRNKSEWKTISDIKNYGGNYFYSNKIADSVMEIKFTIYKVTNMTDAYAQIGQFIFIHPEATAIYDGLVVKQKEYDKEIKEIKDNIPKSKFYYGSTPPSDTSLIWVKE